MGERVLVLDGSPAGGPDLGPVRDLLLAELARRGARTRTVTLREQRLAPCRGCFGCWVETPGRCRSRDDADALLADLLACDTAVLLGPVAFGGHGAVLKRFVDHWIQTALPFFVNRRGETHHPARYPRFPRLVAIGVAPAPDPAAERLLQALVVRNSLNFAAPPGAAGIVPPAATLPELARILDGALPGTPLPLPAPTAGPDPWRTGGPGRALLLVGSPKVGPSTSAVLGDRILAGLEDRGWARERLVLGPALQGPEGREALLAAATRADLLLLAFPLYIDALPYYATLALEQLGSHPLAGKALAVLVNNGFPEARQNEVALAICARFAADTGLAWAGSLALGAGEALCGGRPLAQRPAPGQPPVGHVLRALEQAAEALAAGRPIPAAAGALAQRCPIPLLPAGLWRRLFRAMGGRHWRQLARQRGGTHLEARPLAGAPS